MLGFVNVAAVMLAGGMVMESQSDDESWMDVEFMDSCASESAPTIRLEEVRAALAKIGGSMDSAIDETRDARRVVMQ